MNKRREINQRKRKQKQLQLCEWIERKKNLKRELSEADRNDMRKWQNKLNELHKQEKFDDDQRMLAWIEKDTNNAHRAVANSKAGHQINKTKDPTTGVLEDNPKKVAEIIAQYLDGH